MDNSFLSALPDDLKEELRRDFNRQKNVLQILTSPKKLVSVPFDDHPSASDVVHKQLMVTSPNDKGSHEPFRGRRRGRPSRKYPRSNGGDRVDTPALQGASNRLWLDSNTSAATVTEVDSQCPDHSSNSDKDDESSESQVRAFSPATYVCMVLI